VERFFVLKNIFWADKVAEFQAKIPKYHLGPRLNAGYSGQKKQSQEVLRI